MSRRARSNQAVVDACDTIVIAVRPQQIDTVLPSLGLRSDQTVLSFVAGVDIARMERLSAPAARVIRVTPLPMIADRQGPLLVYPRADDVIALFDGLGTVIVPETQKQVMALGYAGGLMATFFEMTNAGIDWLEGETLPRETARDYLMSMYAALGATGRTTPVTHLPNLPAEFSTPGGINERCHAHLREVGWFDEFQTGLDAMKRHLEALQAAE